MALGKRALARLIDRGHLVVDPLTPETFQTAGMQLALGNRLAIMNMDECPVIDPARGVFPEWSVFDIPEDGFHLTPGTLVLGHTLERVKLPRDILGMVDGRSTMARIGLTPHAAAMAIWPGHGDPDPRSITLEIINNGPKPIVLRPGLLMCNMTFHHVESPSDSYDTSNGRYAGDNGILLPRRNGRETIDLGARFSPGQLEAVESLLFRGVTA